MKLVIPWVCPITLLLPMPTRWILSDRLLLPKNTALRLPLWITPGSIILRSLRTRAYTFIPKWALTIDRKSTRLNSSHVRISYAVFCLKKKTEGREFVRYCAEGLKSILAACPSITAVQMRMNHESGVSMELQTEFFQSQFEAVSDACRP